MSQEKVELEYKKDRRKMGKGREESQEVKEGGESVGEE